MIINEKNYVKELKLENEKALDYIYKSYCGLAYKIAFDVLKEIGTKEDVEECVSDIFIGIWNNISKYDENITTFKKWFIAVSKYKAIDYKRIISNKNRNVELDEEKLVDSFKVEEKIIVKEDMDILQNMINEMKDIDKTIFIKRYLNGESIASISSELGLSRGAIDNRISRGKKVLKNKWVKLLGR